jgi:hypothetical protein
MGASSEVSISQAVLDTTDQWIPRLARMWHEDIPTRIHSGGTADDGSPRWDPAFAAWLMGVKSPGERPRITHAMRRLRKVSVREFEVAYRVIVLGESLEGTMAWLNERAARNRLSDRYTERDTRIILMSAIDKLVAWS